MMISSVLTGSSVDGGGGAFTGAAWSSVASGVASGIRLKDTLSVVLEYVYVSAMPPSGARRLTVSPLLLAAGVKVAVGGPERDCWQV